MRSGARPVAREATSIHGRPRVFRLLHEAFSAPVPVAFRKLMKTAPTFFSAGAGVRRGREPGCFLIPIGGIACLPGLANCR
jgi:hypothetical protein